MIADQIIIPVVNPNLFLAYRADITGHALQRLLQPDPRPSSVGAAGRAAPRGAPEALPRPKRIAVMPFLLLGIASIVFVVSRLTPGRARSCRIVGERNLNNPEVVAASQGSMGARRPDPGAVRRSTWQNLVRGDMGTSFTTRKPVLDDLLDRLPATLELTITALVIGIVVGVGLGVLAARTSRNRSSTSRHGSSR